MFTFYINYIKFFLLLFILKIVNIAAIKIVLKIKMHIDYIILPSRINLA